MRHPRSGARLSQTRVTCAYLILWGERDRFLGWNWSTMQLSADVMSQGNACRREEVARCRTLIVQNEAPDLFDELSAGLVKQPRR